jgi:hypothetical protein
LSVEPLEGRCVPTTLTPTTFADGGLGSGSLRDAVLQFNADGGSADDTIQLLAGTYTLSIQNPGGVHETAGLTGDLNLTQASHRWIIQGAGSSGDQATVIDASQLQDRVFQVVNPGIQVVFQHLVIQGGLARDNGADGAVAGQTDALGGGLLNNGGAVTLEDVVVQNNQARGGDAAQLSTPGHHASGGGIYSTGGALTLAGATLANNQVLGGRGGAAFTAPNHAGNGGDGLGGGLYATGGSLDISDSLIASNHATGGRGGDGFTTRQCTTYYCTTHFYGGMGGAGQGGGLYASGGSLTLATSTVANNQATAGAAGLDGFSGPGQGGGLHNIGMLTVTGSTFSGNTANVFGGGIYNSGMLTVTGSTLSGNTATYNGGGIYNSGMLTVTGSTVSSNTAGHGGGISNSGTLTITGSTLAGNTAGGFGGGIYNEGRLPVTVGTLTVTFSTLSGNSAAVGGGIENEGTLTVTGSTFSADTGRLDGGGIENENQFDLNRARLTVSNSTLSGNSTGYFGGGIRTVFAPPITLTNVTLTANRSGTAGAGGGLVAHMAVLHNTLIAGNFNGPGGRAPDDVWTGAGSLDPGGDNNLIGDGTGMTGLSNGVNGNQVGTGDHPIDPRLGPLADNGGPTLTHALLPGSPAIDAGNNAYATDFDQRGPGFPRIVNGIIDIGAFEFQGAGAGPAPSRSSRGQQAGLAELVAGLPPSVSHPVAQPPALSPGRGSTTTGGGPFVAPWEAAPGLAVAAADSYFATVFEDRSEQATVPWSDLEPAAIGWLPEWAPHGAADARPDRRQR